MMSDAMNNPAGRTACAIPPFPRRSSGKDAALSFNASGHRLSSLYRVFQRTAFPFNVLEILKSSCRLRAVSCEHLGNIDRLQAVGRR